MGSDVGINMHNTGKNTGTFLKRSNKRTYKFGTFRSLVLLEMRVVRPHAPTRSYAFNVKNRAYVTRV